MNVDDFVKIIDALTKLAGVFVWPALLTFVLVRYAPALKDSVVHRIDYYAYQEIVASGKQDVNKAANLVMPAFGTNRNVWCYVDDIYVYLLARGTEAIPRGRPADRADKSEEFSAQEASCMEG